MTEEIDLNLFRTVDLIVLTKKRENLAHHPSNLRFETRTANLYHSKKRESVFKPFQSSRVGWVGWSQPKWFLLLGLTKTARSRNRCALKIKIKVDIKLPTAVDDEPISYTIVFRFFMQRSFPLVGWNNRRLPTYPLMISKSAFAQCRRHFADNIWSLKMCHLQTFF